MAPATVWTRDEVLSRVEVSASGCWLWTRRTDRQGYGEVDVRGRMRIAHRFVYELLVGPVLDGLFLDHVCHSSDALCAGGPTCPHRRCVNPAHLEPVTQAENNRRIRRDSCRKGHALTPENTWVDRNNPSNRRCRACWRVNSRAYKERRATA